MTTLFMAWETAQGGLTSTSGRALRDIALGLVGTFALVVLGVRALGAFADERYGKIVTSFLAAVPIIGFAYFPDATTALLKTLFTAFIGDAA
ncbi:hypothetical protein [Actinokineospora sp. HUAS TT18]|uniref:hypothetical protein n=1 Tax=Actinokineospora sp. HUAS TT18 TaxID=3447451 RepID=UPI003F524B3E